MLKLVLRVLIVILLLALIVVVVRMFAPKTFSRFKENIICELFWGDCEKKAPVLGDKVEEKCEKVHKSAVIDQKPVENPGKRSVKEEVLLQPLPLNHYFSIDSHARHAPELKTIEELASYLDEKAESKLDKSRAIYVWLCEHISYDDSGYNGAKLRSVKPEAVLVNRSTVCEGYANLFEQVGLRMGLEIEKVIGFSKGYGSSVRDVVHAWNRIKINGSWRIFDATWGASHSETINGKLHSVKHFDDYWFNLGVYEAVFSHLPEENTQKVIKPAVSRKLFQALPNIGTTHFKLGFNAENIFDRCLADLNAEFPTVFSYGTPVEMLTAPASKHLTAELDYKFMFDAPRAYEMAIVDAENHWTYFERDKGVFSLAYQTQVSGELKVVIRHEGLPDKFTGVLQYQVK